MRTPLLMMVQLLLLLVVVGAMHAAAVMVLPQAAGTWQVQMERHSSLMWDMGMHRIQLRRRSTAMLRTC
jgi:hypothetical protein